ncbi:hypothetical protein [Streptomyces avicenniae]|uniref:hypothetical protein n=1 Tax=Streptomyces avicenniae TaxID=500153 RepID=UPI0006993224|nr:hypothetical protein [Streptomyces avicenniae]
MGDEELHEEDGPVREEPAADVARRRGPTGAHAVRTRGDGPEVGRIGIPLFVWRRRRIPG